MPKEPEEVLPEEDITPLCRIEEVRADQPVQGSNRLVIITAGMAKITIKDVTSIDHTYSGRRLSDMPGARSLKIVTMSSTEAASAESSVKLMS